MENKWDGESEEGLEEHKKRLALNRAKDREILEAVSDAELLAAWDVYDGIEPPRVGGRSVDEHELVKELYRRGHRVVIG